MEICYKVKVIYFIKPNSESVGPKLLTIAILASIYISRFC